MRSTMLKLFLVQAIAAAAALASHPAQAETVKVPFAFSALGHEFPAGTYTVDANINTNVVKLRLENGNKSVISILGPGDPDPGDQRVMLRFTNTAGTKVLDSIQWGGKITSRLSQYDPHAREAGSPAAGQ
jgi:hypothetical protein